MVAKLGRESNVWKNGNQRYLRMRKRARGALSPDIDPYSRETKETSIDKPIRMSRYLRWKMYPDEMSEHEISTNRCIRRSPSFLIWVST